MQKDEGKDGSYEKSGYLYDDFKMFHIKDNMEREYAYHYHDFYKLLIFLRGNVTYSIEGKSYKLKPFDMVLVNKEAIHRPEVSASEPYERIVFYISGEYLEKHKTGDYDLAYCFMRAKEEGFEVLRFPAMMNARLLSVVEEIENNGREDARYAAALYANVLFMEFMILVNRGCKEGVGTFEHSANFKQKTIDLIQYVGEHLKEDLTIEELSERFYISKFHMMRQFKEETGYTIHQYITEKRVLLAKSLMVTGMSATQACFASGFKDYSTFLRAYKRRMQKSPTEQDGED